MGILKEFRKQNRGDRKSIATIRRFLGFACALCLCVGLIGCSSNNIEDKPNNETVTTSNKEYQFESENMPSVIEGNGASAELKNTKIVKSSQYGALLIMDFKYVNNSSSPSDLINDAYCAPMVYQNGKQLYSTGYTDEPGLYDSSDAFTSIKDGASVETQLVWVLEDTVNPLELDFGQDESYNPVTIAKIMIKDGDKSNINKSVEKKKLVSDYKVKWESEIPSEVKSDTTEAEIGNIAVVNSKQYGDLLIIEFNYTNHSDSRSNLINDFGIVSSVYQNGRELSGPGSTSEEGLFDCSEAFREVKNDGKVSTQLVLALEDTKNPIEVNFGMDENENPMFTGKVVFE